LNGKAVVLVEKEMKAAVLYGKEDLQIESVAVPSIGDGDVLVRVQAALTFPPRLSRPHDCSAGAVRA
jgi:hypothetical protein